MRSRTFVGCGCKIRRLHLSRGGNVTIPPRPPDTSTSSKPFLFTAGDQQLVPIGASHISS